MNTENHKTNTFGYGIAAITGVAPEIVQAMASTILTSVAGPNFTLQIESVSQPISGGGLYLLGQGGRIPLVLDYLMSIVRSVQKARQRASTSARELLNAQPLTQRPGASNLALNNIDRVLKDNPHGLHMAHALIEPQSYREPVERPTLYVENMGAMELLSLAKEPCYESLLWIDTGAQINSASEKERKRLLEWICGTVHTIPTTKSSRRIDPFYSELGYIGYKEVQSETDELTYDDLHQLERGCIVLKIPEAPYLSTLEGQDLHTCLDADIYAWGQAVYCAAALRDHGRTYTAKVPASGLSKVLKTRKDFIQQIHEGNLGLDTQDYQQLLSRLMFLHAIVLERSTQLVGCPFLQATDTAYVISTLHVGYRRSRLLMQHDNTLERQKNALVRAIERRGGQCSWTELRRSLDVQRREAHEDAINALIADGTLTLIENGQFRLAKEIHAA